MAKVTLSAMARIKAKEELLRDTKKALSKKNKIIKAKDFEMNRIDIEKETNKIIYKQSIFLWRIALYLSVFCNIILALIN